MLRKLNAQEGGLLYKVVFGLLSFLIAISFTIWGVGDMFLNPNRTVVVAEVGDVEILGEEFLRLYSQQTESVQSLLGVALDGKKARELGFIDSVMSDLVRKALFDNEARRMDLTVSDKMTRDKIIYLDEFQDEAGVFSELIYRQLLREVGYDERTFAEDFKRDLERRQLVASIGAGPRIPQIMVEPLMEFRHEKRSARSVLLQAEEMPEPIEPGIEPLKRWFEDKKEDFAAPTLYQVTYLSLEPEDLKGEIEIDEEDVRDLYEQRLYFFSKAERRQILQILVDDEKKAYAIESQLREGGEFKKVAQKEAGLSEEDVSLGWNSKEELLTEWADDVFELEQGELSEPLQSPFGWHIFKIEDIEEASTLSFEEARADLLAELQTYEAAEAIYQLLANVEDSLAGGASLEEAGIGINIQPHTIEAIDSEGKNEKGIVIEKLPQEGRFLRAIKDYQEDGRSDIHETELGGFFVLRVDDVTPPRMREFDEVSKQVLAQWSVERQGEIAEQKGQAIQKAVASGMAFEQAVEGFKIVPFEQFTRSNFLDNQVPGEIAQALFDAKKGKLVATLLKEGYMVAILDKVEEADLEDEKLVRLSQEEVILSIAQDLLQQYRRYLEKIYPVTISDRAIDALLL